MPRKTDCIIIVDIESTCWEKEIPLGEESEIIEIGICSFDIGSAQPLDKSTLVVKPLRSSVSPFCTQLTTLTQDIVNEGISFEKACSILVEKYLTRSRYWASYGEYDRLMFEKQCLARNVNYPFSPEHINVKTLFSIIMGIPKQVGMGEALKILKLELEGTHHRGMDDAWNIARILSKLLLYGRSAKNSIPKRSDV